MESILIYPAGDTLANRYAADCLKASGIPVIDHPSPEVTHLLLDVPSFDPKGFLRSGGAIETILAMLPPDVVVVGGNLQHQALTEYRVMDLLQNPAYVAENAAITADCALRVAAERLPIVFGECPTLVIGWGRIGKCLGKMLKALGVQVTVCARKAADRAMLTALGYEAVDTGAMVERLPQYRLIFNTAPEEVVPREALHRCASCLKIDLASQRGLAGEDVIWARGLPGIHAPESSGRLIARTIIEELRGEGK